MYNIINTYTNNTIQSPKIKYATFSVLFVAWLGICFELITILLNLSFKLPNKMILFNGHSTSI